MISSYMKTCSTVLLALPILLVISTSASATTTDANVSSNDNASSNDNGLPKISHNTSHDDGSFDDAYYIGIKTGLIMIDENIAQSIDTPFNYGAYLGYRFNQNFGVEIDYTVSQESDVTNAGGDKGVYEIATYGTYLTYYYPLNNMLLSNTPLYAKAKLGVGGAEVDEKYLIADALNQHSSDDVGVAGGIGLGMYLKSNVLVETEFTMLRSDNIDTNALTASAHVQF